jgi:hypothetical protein
MWGDFVALHQRKRKASWRSASPPDLPEETMLPQAEDVGFVIYRMISPNTTPDVRYNDYNIGDAMERLADARIAQFCYSKNVTRVRMARHTKRGRS